MVPLNRFLAEAVEFPVARVVADLEDHGYPVDAEYLRTLRGQLMPRRQQVLAEIRTEAARHGMAEFNPNSPGQVQKLVYDKLGRRVVARTTNGSPSVDAVTLTAFAAVDPIIGQILEFRELARTVGTYCAIADQVDDDGRYRVSYDSLGAETGRFTSKSLIQTLPRDDRHGVRAAFRAEPGYRIVAADYEQQELRILAALSDDPALRSAIRDGVDLHGAAAVKVFDLDCEPHEVKTRYPREREQVKAIQYGVLYGRGAAGIARELGIANEDAMRLIGDYFSEFPAVKEFMAEVESRVCRDGYVDDCFGRRRHIPDAQIAVPGAPYVRLSQTEKSQVAMRNRAIRAAQNFVIQGPAATITKLAMIATHRFGWQFPGDGAELILSLHDELQFHVPIDLAADLANQLPALMAELPIRRFGITVPMAVTVSIGPSWGELSPWASKHAPA